MRTWYISGPSIKDLCDRLELFINTDNIDIISMSHSESQSISRIIHYSVILIYKIKTVVHKDK